MKLQGVLNPPGDKSISHRIVLFSLLAKGEIWIENLSPCADVQSSLAAVQQLGATLKPVETAIVLGGIDGKVRDQAWLDCGNSGTTIRLLMGVLAGRCGQYTLDGDDSLRRRPMERVAEPLRLMGAKVETTVGRGPVKVYGQSLKGLNYRLPVASAQLKSAILLAGIQADSPTTILEPHRTRDHTERMIDLMGGRIKTENGQVFVEKSHLVLPSGFRVPGDVSAAAFFVCAATVFPGSRLTIDKVLLNPTRTGFLHVLERMGANWSMDVQGLAPEPWGRIGVRSGPTLNATEISAAEIPLLIDEIPILAFVATQAHGTTVFRQVAELRVKESDRLAAIVQQLGLLGADVHAIGDDLVINGPTPLKCPEVLDSYGDHRLAMTLRLASLLAEGNCPITAEDSVAISYPDFHKDLDRIVK